MGGCSNMATAHRSPVRRLWTNPEKMKNTSQRLVPRCITASIVLPVFFGRNACLFGENKPTALMDNTGEGTLGTGLWERKSEQKKPFTLLSVSYLIKKKKAVVASCWDRDCIWGALKSLSGGHLPSWQTSTSLWGQSNRKWPALHTKVKDDGWAGAGQGREGRQTVSVVTSWEQQFRDGTQSDMYPLKPSQCSAVFFKVWLSSTGVKKDSLQSSWLI